MRLKIGDIELFQDILDDLKFRIKIYNPTMSFEVSRKNIRK